MTTSSIATVGALLDALPDPALRAATLAILRSVVDISLLLRHGGSMSGSLAKTSVAGADSSTNAFGDAQLQIDVQSDNLIRSRLGATGYVRVCSSEEDPVEREVSEAATATLAVGYDPLDGSSVVASNFSVGSIFGVWRSGRIVGSPGTDVVLAMAAVYGPRTVVYVGGPDLPGGVYEVSLHCGIDPQGNAEQEGDNEVRACAARNVGTMQDGIGKLFAPANLRATADLPGYQQLVAWYMQQRYTLRYTGAMVPDVTQLLVKRHGVFVSPVSPSARAKLRLVYEAIPMAVLVEAAGGRSSDGSGSVTARTVQGCEERTGVCVGSTAEVERFESMCGSGANGAAPKLDVAK